ncbi:P-loop NTPase family protein [Spirosoma aerolatum]|uniref:adenylate kinase n=1 Tax=Spirosoma aerolatum TaxID=1211326 RepID=UPI0009AF04E2|nr:adenylate kinase [Spirosoma aerolatum]
MRIHIFGASGSGVTTLGNALSTQTGIPYFDTDAYYWIPSNPPYLFRRDPTERIALLTTDLSHSANWIVGGSLLNWGDQWLSAFDLAVFLWVPPSLRLERLRKREFERYGDVIFTDKDRHQQYEEFIDWASGYDTNVAHGRTLQAHENWMQKLTCPLIELRGNHTVTERLDMVARQLALQNHR